MNKIAIIGTGYVGLVTGCCLAESGKKVICVDIDKDKIENLNKSISPIYEPGLDDFLKRNLESNRIEFTTNLRYAIDNSWCVFLCLPTPSNEDGSANLTYVLESCTDIANILNEGNNKNEKMIVVNKSTVPVGTHISVKRVFEDAGLGQKIIVASNPEFLREGFALEDFMKPDRVVIGTSDAWAKERLEKLYEPFTRSGNPIIIMDEYSSEMTKYAANAFLAVKISYMNELAQLCEKVGANIDDVRKGIGSDNRIGKRFLFPGIGYGGSCFTPKEIIKLTTPWGGARNITLEELWNTSNTIQESDVSTSVKMKDFTDSPLEVHGFNFTTMTKEPQKILSLTKRSYDGDTITYVTSTGHTQTITEDHPVIICNENTPTTIVAGELAVGDCIYIIQDVRNSKDLSKNFNIDDVVVVKKTKTEYAEVYSLETSNETVITGNGIISHNCFPKDVRSILSTAKDYGVDLSIIDSAMSANSLQRSIFIEKIENRINELNLEDTPQLAIWGLAFKPNTDDIREAPAIDIINHFLDLGCKISSYDPEAKDYDFDNANYTRVSNPFDATKNADILIICTEWTEFRNIDFSELKNSMKRPEIIDGRNLWKHSDMVSSGFHYISVGRQ